MALNVYQKDNLPQVLPGFENINRYFDSTNKVYTAKILPGEYYVTRHDEMITTVLGSCISACIRDPELGIGGMNHFMLPIDRRNKDRTSHIDEGAASRYGNFAMELLVNEVLKNGGKRKRLEVKLFGGGKVISEMNTSDIGNKNIRFALDYLDYEGFNVVAQDVGDIYPRKVNYFPATGQVRVKKLRQMHNTTITQREQSYYKGIVKKPDNSSELELFKS